jgi:hypothetical protein
MPAISGPIEIIHSLARNGGKGRQQSQECAGRSADAMRTTNDVRDMDKQNETGTITNKRKRALSSN